NYVSLVQALNVADEKTLLVLPTYNNNVYLSSRNLKKAKVIAASDLNTYDVLNATKLLLTADSVKTLEEAFAKEYGDHSKTNLDRESFNVDGKIKPLCFQSRSKSKQDTNQTSCRRNVRRERIGSKYFCSSW